MFKRFLSMIMVICILCNGIALANTLEMKSKAAVLMDANTGKILYESNSHEKRHPASVTKVMTILLIMEAIDSGKISLEDRVTCSENASQMGGSQIWLDTRETLSVHEMLKAICVVSANDCCVAMAEHIAGSEAEFVSMMNAKAKELGMNDTNFVNCHGLDEDTHLTSAHDIALMSRELITNHPRVFDYTTIWMDSLRDGKSELVNTNKLLRTYKGANGLKTGSTSLALFNLSATAKRDNLQLIGVIMGGATSKERNVDAANLLDYGFANFASLELDKKDTVLAEVKISKGEKDKVNAVLQNDVFALIQKGNDKNVEKEIILDGNLTAPIEKGAKAGEVVYRIKGEVVGREKLVLSEDVGKTTIAKSFAKIMLNWVKVGRE